MFAWLLSGDGPLRKKIAPYQQISSGTLAGKEVLEIGAGSGANIPYYISTKSVVLLEPNTYSHFYLREKVEQSKIPNAKIEEGIAERLPFNDDSFDVVVTNLVLCSVQDVTQSLSEIKRVLRPGGQYIFLEHVAAEEGWAKGLQRLIRPVWLKVADGCDCRRNLLKDLQNAEFTELTAKSVYKVSTFVFKPILVGTARK